MTRDENLLINYNINRRSGQDQRLASVMRWANEGSLNNQQSILVLLGFSLKINISRHQVTDHIVAEMDHIRTI